MTGMTDNSLTDALKTLLGAGSAINGKAVQDQANIEPYIVRPKDWIVEQVPSDWLKNPSRIAGNVIVYDPEAFIDYFSDFQDKYSRIFVDKEVPQILGVLDYHQYGDDATAAKPNWGQHTVKYEFRPTDEWTTWKNASGVKMAQINFATFIEDNLDEITIPSPATMLEISRTLVAKKDVDFMSSVHLPTRQIQLTYSETIRGTASVDTKEMEIPEVFNLLIAPFEGSPRYNVKARLRYQITGKDLQMWYELVRPEKVEEMAVKATVEEIRKKVTHPILNGRV